MGVAQLVIVPTSAQSPLGRHDRYAKSGEISLLRATRAGDLSAYSEVLEESQECVGGSVAAWFGVEGFGAVDRLLFVAHVGVQVDVGGRDLLVLDMRVIWRLNLGVLSSAVSAMD